MNQQAVALRITGDFAAFYNCGFYGSQDTLNDDMGRHYYKNCEIVGSIDFIFGDAQSLYKVLSLSCAISTLIMAGNALHRHQFGTHLLALSAAGLYPERECCHIRLRDGTEARIEQQEHGILVRWVQSSGVRASVPRPSVGTLLARRLCFDVHAGHRHSRRLAQLERA